MLPLMHGQVVLLVGVSGAGKTTWARRHFANALRVSADDYFYEGGQYRFEPAEIQRAHDACFRKYIDAMQTHAQCIVVDNTNTTLHEITPYALGAGAFDYAFRIAVFDVAESQVDAVAKRNVHGVQPQSVRAQLRRQRELRLHPRWPVTRVQVEV